MPTTISRQSWRQLWLRLVTPSRDIQDESQRQQAILLASLSLALLLAGLVVVFFWVLSNPDYAAAPYIALGVVAALAVIYVLSCTRYYKIGAFILVSATALAVAAIVLTAPGPLAERTLAMNFLVIAILLASILLSAWLTLAVVGACLTGMAIFFAVSGAEFEVAYSMLVFAVLTSALLIVATRLRNSYVNQLTESRRRYRALFRQTSDAVFIIDLDGRYQEVNQSAVDMLGYPAEEVLEMTYREAATQSEMADSEAAFQKLLANEQLPIYERTLRRKNGTEIPAEVNVALVRDDDGKPLFIQSIARDISQRKQAEETLKQQEEYLRVLFEQTPVGIVTVDMAGNVTDANPHSLEILGSPGASATREVNVLTLPNLVEAGISALLDRALTRGETVAREAWYTSMWNKTAYVYFRAVPHFDSQGRQLGLIILLEDLTERVLAEEGMRQMQKMESLSVLAGGVAHDFNNLLVAILGQTSLALSQLPADVAGRVHVEKAVFAGQQAARLTQQLLAYSGRGRFEVDSIDMDDLIDINTHLFSATIPKHIELITDLHDGLPPVEADVTQMQQVVMNLVINAAEALADRHGTITVATGVQEIAADGYKYAQYTAKPLPDGTYVVVEVADDGPGMTAETLEKIFDPFFTTKERGHGLGLAAVLGIIKGHGGGLAVSSKAGQGTRFKMLFPVTSKPVTVEPVSPVYVNGHMGGTVLVIDDEVSVREAVSDILSLKDIEVLTAPDGRKGLDIYLERQAEIDLVLLDLSMPGWNGEETMNELRQVNGEANIILSSGYNEIEATERFAGKGLKGFLQKPYTAEKLLETVQGHLHN